MQTEDTAMAAAPPLGWAAVRGPSMVPTLRDGDRLLVWYGVAVRDGDVVVARHPFQQDLLVVKRAVEWRSRAAAKAGGRKGGGDTGGRDTGGTGGGTGGRGTSGRDGGGRDGGGGRAGGWRRRENAARDNATGGAARPKRGDAPEEMAGWPTTPARAERKPSRRGSWRAAAARGDRRDGGWWLLGDNPYVPNDSREFGTVPEELVLGRVVARYRPRTGYSSIVAWLFGSVRPLRPDRSLSRRLRAR
jgi:Peptidase S24-like